MVDGLKQGIQARGGGDFVDQLTRAGQIVEEAAQILAGQVEELFAVERGGVNLVEDLFDIGRLADQQLVQPSHKGFALGDILRLDNNEELVNAAKFLGVLLLQLDIRFVAVDEVVATGDKLQMGRGIAQRHPDQGQTRGQNRDRIACGQAGQGVQGALLPTHTRRRGGGGRGGHRHASVLHLAPIEDRPM